MASEKRDTMRPKKGDLLLKMHDGEGSVTVLIPKANIKPYHRLAMKQMVKVLGVFMGPPKKRPHPMASALTPPCSVCGWTWQRPVVDTSDPDAKELPIYSVCLGCGKKQDDARPSLKEGSEE